jgi:hypothetical protein
MEQKEAATADNLPARTRALTATRAAAAFVAADAIVICAN